MKLRLREGKPLTRGHTVMWKSQELNLGLSCPKAHILSVIPSPLPGVIAVVSQRPDCDPVSDVGGRGGGSISWLTGDKWRRLTHLEAMWLFLVSDTSLLPDINEAQESSAFEWPLLLVHCSRGGSGRIML